jgi:hypothetical protein
MPEFIRQAARKIKEKSSKFLDLLRFYFVPQRKKLFIGVFVVFASVALLYGGVAHAFGWDDIIKTLNDISFTVAGFLAKAAAGLFSMILMVSTMDDYLEKEAAARAWYLIRDICNMFFVVLLLLVAFAEIFNIEKYNIRTFLPKLLLAAVLVNFSKMLCGLAIDMAQVVMMTFVNAYQEAAGANMLVGLQLQNLFKGNPDAGAVVPDGSAVFSAINFANVYLLFTVLIIMGLVIVLFVRYIVLVFGVAVSPVFFMAEVIPIFGDKLKKYRDQFFGFVAIGPVCAFFLWFSLLLMSENSTAAQPTAMMDGGSVYVANDDQKYNDIQSDPNDKHEVLLAAASAGEKAMTEGLVKSVTAGGTLDSLIQSAMGLTALAFTLVASQELGGAAGALAGGLVDFGKKSARIAGRKATAPIVSRASELAKRTKRAAGRGVDLAVGGGKKLATAGFEGVRLAGTSAGAAAIGGTLGAAGMAMSAAGFEERGEKLKAQGGSFIKDNISRAAERASFNIKAAGSSEFAAADKIGKETFKEKLGEAETRLEGMGINKDYDAQNRFLTAGVGKREDLQALSLSLANAGKLDSKAQVSTARSVLSDDKESLEAFNSAVADKQAHLAYDLSDNKSSKESKYGRNSFEERIASGSLKVGEQDKAFYSDSRAMQSALSAMGAERFAKTMEKVHDRAEDFAAPAKQAMVSAIAGIQGKETKTATDQKALDSLRQSFVSSGGSVSAAFSGVPAAERGRAVGAFLGNAGTKALGKMNLSEYLDSPDMTEETKALMAGNIEPGQLVKLADSEEEHASENLSQLVGQLESASAKQGADPGLVQRYRQVASNPKIMEKVHSSVGGRVAARQQAETARSEQLVQSQRVLEQAKVQEEAAAKAYTIASQKFESSANAIEKADADDVLVKATQEFKKAERLRGEAEKALAKLTS